MAVGVTFDVAVDDRGTVNVNAVAVVVGDVPADGTVDFLGPRRLAVV